MRKKLFTFLLALTASIGMMWAETVVVINKSEFTSSGVTKEGVTLALSSGSMTSSDVEAMNGSFEFSTSLGKFTGITIETDANIMEIYEGAFTSAGWPTGDNLGTSAVWTGESEKVLISCVVAGMDNITITCTIEPTPANSCGDGLTWELNAGVFTISYDGVGTGVMDDFDYSEHPAPWQSSKESITSVIIPDGVTRIGNNAFSGANNLASVSMGDDVVAIGNNAFEACNSLSSITLSSHVTTIGDHAFAGLQSLTSIVLPSTVQSIGTSAFYGNEGLTSITCEGTTPPTLGQYVFGMIGNGATLYVPYGYAETYQGADAQWQALNIQVIGSGSASYPYCGDGLTWTYNDGVLTIIYDGVGTGDMLDYGNYNIYPWDSYKEDITSVIIPDGVIRIGNYAFANLTNLASVSMGDDVVEIGYGGFWNCLSLQSITLGSHVTTIGEHAFGSNQALTSITLPNTLQTIGGSAFYNCNSLPTITIPSSVTSFGEYAFGFCEGLTSFTCEGTTPPTLGQDVFTMVPYHRPLYVPDGYVETYQGADSQWQKFDISIIPAPTPTDEQVPTNADPENQSYHYSTFFHSTQNYKLTNDGTQAFIADLSGSDLVLTEIANGTQVIPANTAVILRKTGSADPVVLTPTEENGVSVNPGDNSLEGVDAITAVTSIDGLTTTNCYVLSGSVQHGVGFYRINSENLKAHKAYVKYAGLQNNAPKRMRFIFNQEQTATGVESVRSSVISSQKLIENGQLIIIKNGVRYNAQGQIVK